MSPMVPPLAKMCFSPRTRDSPTGTFLVVSSARMVSCETLKAAIIPGGPGRLFCSPVAGVTLLQEVRSLSLSVYHGTWSSGVDIRDHQLPAWKPPQ